MSLPYLLIGSKYMDGVEPLIQSAKHTIDIIMYDWRLYKGQAKHPVMRLTDALSAAVARGVRVRALVGLPMFIPQLKQRGLDVRQLILSRTVHAKIMCIDGTLCVLGSHNLTQNAMTRNLEISLIADLGDVAAQFSDYFGNLWGV